MDLASTVRNGRIHQAIRKSIEFNTLGSGKQRDEASVDHDAGDEEWSSGG